MNVYVLIYIVVQTSKLLQTLCMQNLGRKYRLALSESRKDQVLNISNSKIPKIFQIVKYRHKILSEITIYLSRFRT